MFASSDDPAASPDVEQSNSLRHVPAKISGTLLLRMFTDATALLERHMQALNAINVYPVPDGDTGTNMHLTMRAAIQTPDTVPSDELSDAAEALAHRALMGARGNSGVILSQVLRGLARSLEGKREAGGAELAAALAGASEAAYAALAEPKEGTILTVIREAAEAVEEEPPAAIDETLARATAAAHAAVKRTPELLPVLKEAGVVDAGGLGLAIILEGFLRSLRGEPLDVDLTPEMPTVIGWQSDAASLHEAEHGATGYCTEFIVSGPSLDAVGARSRLAAMGESLLVVGDEDVLRVHVHTTTPDAALDYGRSLGQVSQVKVDNMEAQMQRFAAGVQTPSPIADIGLVAVAAGGGIKAAFRSVGVTHLVEGGQTMNPSAGELLQAIESCPQDKVFVLPNNKNIIAAAEQAAETTQKQAKVLHSESIPQGVAAVLALNPDLSFEENSTVMTKALSSVRSAEVARAVRATVIDGRRVEAGQAIAIVDGELSVVSSDLAEAVHDAVRRLLVTDATLLTVYVGQDVREQDADTLVRSLGERYPGIEVELVPGGQPHYAYLLSME